MAEPTNVPTLDKTSYTVGETAYLSVEATDPDNRDVPITMQEGGLTGIGSVHFTDELTITVETPGWTPAGDGRWSYACAAAGEVQATVTVRDSQGHAVTRTVSAPVTAPRVAFPLWLSPHVEPGETTVQSWRRHIGYGGGLFIMRSPTAGTVWDQPFKDLASSHGSVPVPILFSPKGCAPSAADAFLGNLPDAWRPWFTLVPWQEPWDDYPTADRARAYRDWVTSLAKPAADHGVRIGLEIQADAFWYAGGRADRQPLDAFVVPGVTSVLLASVYSYNGKDELATRVPQIAAKAKALGLPWAVAASAMPIKGAITAAQSAAWSKRLYELAKANGSCGHGHYSYRQGSPPYPSMIDGDSRLSTIPELMTVWRGIVADAGPLAERRESRSRS